MTPAPRASLAALGLLLPLLKPYLPRVLAAIAALLLAAGLTLALGQGLKHLIDDGFAGGPGALDRAALVMGALVTALAISTTMGRISAISPASFALVSTNIRKAPAPVMAWRTPMEMADPISDCSRPISAVRRDMTSPIRAVSK